MPGPIKKTYVDGFEHLEIEPGPPTPPVKMVINPVTGDGWRAIDILEEIQFVLKRRGYALKADDDKPFKLVKITGGGPAVIKARIVAYVREVSQYGIERLEL
jgi:hypothetical protein